MATAFARTVLLYFILIAGIRALGKRQIGELEPTELVLMLLISDLAAVPMQDFGIPLLNGAVPIVTLLALSMLLSFFSARSVRFHRLLCGSPTVLIENGAIRQDALRRNRFTLDELLDELRAQGVTDIKAVKYAVLETNGKLSVLPRAADAPATPRQLGVSVPDDVWLPAVLVSDGRVLSRALAERGLDGAWLKRTLRAHGFQNAAEVLLLTVDGAGRVLCVGKEKA